VYSELERRDKERGRRRDTDDVKKQEEKLNWKEWNQNCDEYNGIKTNKEVNKMKGGQVEKRKTWKNIKEKEITKKKIGRNLWEEEGR
jgi:hypothetical protein